MALKFLRHGTLGRVPTDRQYHLAGETHVFRIRTFDFAQNPNRPSQLFVTLVRMGRDPAAFIGRFGHQVAPLGVPRAAGNRSCRSALKR